MVLSCTPGYMFCRWLYICIEMYDLYSIEHNCYTIIFIYPHGSLGTLVAEHKTGVTPLLTCWVYHSLALSHWCKTNVLCDLIIHMIPIMGITGVYQNFYDFQYFLPSMYTSLPHCTAYVWQNDTAKILISYVETMFIPCGNLELPMLSPVA